MPSPLAWQTIDIPLGGGQDESAHPFLLNAPASLEVINGRFNETGAIEKRYGYGYADFTPTDTPHTLLAHGSQRVVVTKEGKVYRYDADNSWTIQPAPRSAATSTRREQHRLVPVELERRSIYRSESGIAYCDAATNSNGLACHVWIDADTAATGGYQLLAMITEADTGRVVDGPVSVAAASTGWERCYVVDIGTTFVVAALDGAPGAIKTYYLDTSPTIGTWTTGATVAAASSNVIDLCKGEGAYAHLSYSLTTNTHLVRLDATGASTQTATIATNSSGGLAVAWDAVNDRLWVVAASTTGNPSYEVCTSAYANYYGPRELGTLAGTQVFACSVVVASSGVAWCAWQEEYAAGVRRAVHIRRATDGGVLANPNKLYNYCIAAHAFYDTESGLPMFPIAWQPDARNTTGGCVRPTVQPLGMVVAPYNFAVASQINPYGFFCVSRFGVDRFQWSTAASGYGIRQNVPSVASYTDSGVTRWIWMGRVRGESSTIESVEAWTLGRSSVPIKRASYEGCEYFAAGALFAYDGLAVQESTPHLAPEGIVYSAAGTGITGTFSWKVVWEWEDAQGILRRSAPSEAGTASPANKTVTISWCDQAIRAREGAALHNLRAALYRTTNGGSVYYLVTRAVPTASATLGDVYLTDNYADATIQVNETLYTTGGELEVAAAPPSLDVLVHKQRCWVIDAERRSEVAYSKLLDQVTTAPEFVGEFRIKLPRGEATALAALDDKIVIFTADDIFVVYGEGPNDTGTLGAFSEPQAVATGVGCTDRCSVVSGDFGVMFRSRRGIELLNRSLQVVPGFGEPMQSTLTSANVITSAVLVPAQNQVRFTRAASAYPLVYDYQAGAWSKWAMFDTPVDAAMVSGTYVWQAANATYAESVGLRSDGIAAGDQHIPMTITTPWIKVGGIQGFVRARRLWLLGRFRGQYYGWTVSIDWDYASSAGGGANMGHTSYAAQSESGAGYNGVTGAPWQLGIHLSRQKFESLRITWTDTSTYTQEGSLTAAEGITLVSIALEVGGKKGLKRLPAAYKT